MRAMLEQLEFPGASICIWSLLTPHSSCCTLRCSPAMSHSRPATIFDLSPRDPVTDTHYELSSHSYRPHAHMLPVTEAEFDHIWQKFDEDNSGAIEYAELKQSLRDYTASKPKQPKRRPRAVSSSSRGPSGSNRAASAGRPARAPPKKAWGQAAGDDGKMSWRSTSRPAGDSSRAQQVIAVTVSVSGSLCQSTSRSLTWRLVAAD